MEINNSQGYLHDKTKIKSLINSGSSDGGSGNGGNGTKRKMMEELSDPNYMPVSKIRNRTGDDESIRSSKGMVNVLNNGDGSNSSNMSKPTIATPGSPSDAHDEILAIQALGQLRNSGTPPPQSTTNSTTNNELLDDEEDDDEFYDTSNDFDAMSQLARTGQLTTSGDLTDSTGFFMRNLKAHPLYNSALRAYRINKPTIKYGVEMMEKAAIPMVNIMEQTRLEWKRKKRLKRANAMFPDEAKFLPYSSSSLKTSSLLYNSKKSPNLPSIAEALSLGNKNLNEFSLNLSIESKKRIATCLQLLMLANKQLSSKIQHLQDLITKEQEFIEKKRRSSSTDDNESLDESTNNDNAIQIKQEIVTTVKKVVSLISKYAGNSLPEPARSNVRQTLLRLPTKWATSTTTDPLNPASQASTSSFASTSASTTTSTASPSSTSSIFNTNGRVLILANESLEMVGSIMSVFDETLTKAELWVKKKQQKQLAKAAILNNLQQSQIGTSQQLQQSQIQQGVLNDQFQQHEQSDLRSVDKPNEPGFDHKGKHNDDDELLSD